MTGAQQEHRFMLAIRVLGSPYLSEPDLSWAGQSHRQLTTLNPHHRRLVRLLDCERSS